MRVPTTLLAMTTSVLACIFQSTKADSVSRDGGHNVCGCQECTEDILNQLAGEYTCFERILYLMEGPHHLSEEEACIRVARTEFQDICGFQCDPGRCDGNKLPAEELPSTYCGCKYCTHDVWQRKTENGHTCGARDRKSVV